MIEPSEISMGRPIWRIQKPTSRQELSFLSLRDARNGYPDTGESGEAYDSEAIINR